MGKQGKPMGSESRWKNVQQTPFQEKTRALILASKQAVLLKVAIIPSTRSNFKFSLQFASASSAAWRSRLRLLLQHCIHIQSIKEY